MIVSVIIIGLGVKMNRPKINWNCLDCKIHTHLIGEYYMLKHDLWKIVNPDYHGMLCISCVEERLGRKLKKRDFLDCLLNNNDSFKSDLLIKRLGRK